MILDTIANIMAWSLLAVMIGIVLIITATAWWLTR
jgi:competence protein ComGF